MSPDEIFAAQFWPWPDPAVKRDATGRVLFVNAAFLQLYGGQAQDWHGNAVGGWPAPMAAGQSHRFETRIPAQVGGMEEQIYDWIEMVFADGSAFALARNVTFFAAPSGPAPVPDEQPEIVDTPPAAANVAPPTADQAPAETPEHAPVNVTAPDVVAKETETESLYSPPTYEAPPAQTEPAAAVVAPGVESVDTIISQAEQTVESTAAAQPDANVYTDTAAPLIEAAEQMVNPLITEPAATEPMPAEPEERAYERRALPIESDSAVLGNNWRDAVIAKAVGAEAAEEINTETSEAEPVPQQSAPQDTSPSENSAGGARKILLAEDNAINALLTRTLLEAEGHTVDTVEDGQLAVEAMKTNSYDLIFMDMRMPNMDGLEATRKIRALPNVSKDLPIIALTANAFDDDRNACFDSGMNDFMTKPVSAEELADMVVNWTAGAKQKIAS